MGPVDRSRGYAPCGAPSDNPLSSRGGATETDRLGSKQMGPPRPRFRGRPSATNPSCLANGPGTPDPSSDRPPPETLNGTAYRSAAAVTAYVQLKTTAISSNPGKYSERAPRKEPVVADGDLPAIVRPCGYLVRSPTAPYTITCRSRSPFSCWPRTSALTLAFAAYTTCPIRRDCTVDRASRGTASHRSDHPQPRLRCTPGGDQHRLGRPRYQPGRPGARGGRPRRWLAIRLAISAMRRRSAVPSTPLSALLSRSREALTSASDC